jgi:hypothetical protein
MVMGVAVMTPFGVKGHGEPSLVRWYVEVVLGRRRLQDVTAAFHGGTPR